MVGVRLEIKNLTVQTGQSADGRLIVDGLSLEIPDHCVFALVGGSGSGKTTTGLAILKLLAPGLRITGGEIRLGSRDLLSLPENELRQVRGKDVSMVFQEPLYAFNPVFTIGQQVEEVFKAHTDISKTARRTETLELFRMVGLPDPKRVHDSYPHQLSGGMRQRAMIAQAIALKPKLLIADEPTSSLDVTLQAKIMELFRQLRKDMDLTVLLITHDLGVVKHLADHVAVMRQGRVVEAGRNEEVLTHPRDAYTKQLLATF